MKLFTFTSILLLIIVLSACRDSKKMKAIQDYMDQTQNIQFYELGYFNKEIIKESDYLMIAYPPSILAHSFSGIFIGKNYNELEFVSQINDIQKKYQYIDVTDTCIIAVSEEKLLRDTCRGLILPNGVNKLLIPDDITHEGITEYYVVKYEHGNFLGDDFSHFYNHSSNLGHGYYAGITIYRDERKIIFWLIIL